MGTCLQNDLLGRLVGLQEVADVDEGPLLAGAAVLPLQVVPPVLDQLLAVRVQLLGHVLDQGGGQLQQLDAQRLLELLAYLQIQRSGMLVRGKVLNGLGMCLIVAVASWRSSERSGSLQFSPLCEFDTEK